MSARARNFLAANDASPVVYCSVGGGCVTYRLANGKMFHLTPAEATQASNPRWDYLELEMGAGALAEHDRSEAETLAKVQAEALG